MKKKCALCEQGRLCMEFTFKVKRFFGMVVPVKKFLCSTCVAKVSMLVDDYEAQRHKKNKRGTAPGVPDGAN